MRAWDQVQVNVEDLLKGRRAISEEHVDSVAWQARPVQRPSQPVGPLEEVGAQALVKGFRRNNVNARDDEQVAWFTGLRSMIATTCSSSYAALPLHDRQRSHRTRTDRSASNRSPDAPRVIASLLSCPGS